MYRTILIGEFWHIIIYVFDYLFVRVGSDIKSVFKAKFNKFEFSVYLLLDWLEGARGVVVIIVGNGHGDTSSNPGRDWLYFT